MKSLAILLVLLSAVALGEQPQPSLVGQWYAAVTKIYGDTEPIVVTPAGVTAKNWCGPRSYKIIQDITVTTDAKDPAIAGRFAYYVPKGTYRLVSISILGKACRGTPSRLQFAFPLEMYGNPKYKYTGNTAYIGFPNAGSMSEFDFSAHTSWGRVAAETPNTSLERTHKR